MSPLLISQSGATITLTLNRPDKRNSLNPELIGALKDAIRAAEKEKSVRIILLKGEGKAFSAGADLAYLQQLQKNTYEENLADSTHLMELFEAMLYSSKLLIAQVEGHALAGGCGLATACDLVFSVPEAKFGYTEVRIGFIPAIVMFFLLRKIGEGRARELLLTGKLISAEEAQRIGLITEVISPDAMEATVTALCESLARDTSPQSIAATRRMMADIQHLTPRQALRYAAEQNAEARGSDDCKKGIGAFLAKEDVKWS